MTYDDNATAMDTNQIQMSEIDGEQRRVMSTSNDEKLSTWDALLETQVELFLPFEIAHLLSNKTWKDSKRLLDAGCGNGYYLSRLKSFFPEKSYFGIDISPEMIGIAESRFGESGIDFENADFLTYGADKPFDMILMRLVVQHMSGFDSILGSAAKLLTSGGVLIVLEPELESFLNVPATPLFTQLLKEYGEFTQKTQLNRAHLSQLGKVVDANANWSVLRQEVVTVPHIGPLEKSKLVDMFLQWIDVFEQSEVLEYPFRNTRDELREWAMKESIFSQIGFRVLELGCDIERSV